MSVEPGSTRGSPEYVAYSHNPECAKCGHRGHTALVGEEAVFLPGFDYDWHQVSFYANGDRCRMAVGGGEHLCLTCQRCGYIFVMEVKA